MANKYISVEEEEAYFLEQYDLTIGDVERAAFLTPNYLAVEETQDIESIKSDMEKTFGIDHDIIGKMAAVDIASGGILPLPEKGEAISVKMVTAPRKIGRIYFARCVIYGREYDLQYDIIILSTIAKGIFAEFEKARLPIDDALKCIVGRVFTIAGRDWEGAPEELWKINNVTRGPVAPRVNGIVLRRYLEAKEYLQEEEATLEQQELLDINDWPKCRKEVSL